MPFVRQTLQQCPCGSLNPRRQPRGVLPIVVVTEETENDQEYNSLPEKRAVLRFGGSEKRTHLLFLCAIESYCTYTRKESPLLCNAVSNDRLCPTTALFDAL
jgi:hypothetical protein